MILAGVALLLILSGMGVVIRLCFLIVTIEGQSMAPTLEPGDRILVIRTHSAVWIRKGCIVLLNGIYTDDRIWGRNTPSNVKPFIKRIVALGGEKLFILSPSHEDIGHRLEEHLWDIPHRHIFVCGDNHQYSIDSRHWGPLPLNTVLGVMVLKLSRIPSASMKRPGSSSHPGLQPGEIAPAFSAPTLNNTIMTLNTYQGRDLLLLFIAPDELSHTFMPSFQDLASRVTATSASVVYAGVGEADRIRAFANEWHITQPVLVVPRHRNPLLNDYHVPGAPFYCFLDGQGRVQASGRLHPHYGTEIEALQQKQAHEATGSLNHPKHPYSVVHSQPMDEDTKRMEA